MGKIKLLKRLWNKEAGEIIEVSTVKESFAVRKGYAEPFAESMEPIKAKVEQTKRIKKVENVKRSKKQNFVGNKSFE